MTDNPLSGAAKPAKVKRTAQEWCDIGNDRLAGKIPYLDGKYETRPDLHWFVENGQPRLGKKLRAS
jgi:hypothetical protein